MKVIVDLPLILLISCWITLVTGYTDVGHGEFEPDGYFTASNIEPGRTRLYWDTADGRDLNGKIAIYATTNTIISSTPYAHNSDIGLDENITFLLTAGLDPSLRQWDHILGNYEKTTFGENISRALSYFMIAQSELPVNHVCYDDDVSTYIHPGTPGLLDTTEINSGGYASASCLSNYFSSGTYDMTAYIFFQPSTEPIDLTAYSDGSIAFYIK
ncbi:MAG TPA: hypothetical protein VKS21_12360, partial [Spirochaetota bacterium]|nr:hypothetical protein [Spirochaetota bacterium]